MVGQGLVRSGAGGYMSSETPHDRGQVQNQQVEAAFQRIGRHRASRKPGLPRCRQRSAHTGVGEGDRGFRANRLKIMGEPNIPDRKRGPRRFAITVHGLGTAGRGCKPDIMSWRRRVNVGFAAHGMKRRSLPDGFGAYQALFPGGAHLALVVRFGAALGWLRKRRSTCRARMTMAWCSAAISSTIACSPTQARHAEGKDSPRFGTSTTSTVGGDAWYHISQTVDRKVAFLNPTVTDQRVLAVYFPRTARSSASPITACRTARCSTI